MLLKVWVNALPQSFFTAFGLCKPDETPLLCSQTTSRHHKVESTDKRTDTDRYFIICAVLHVFTFQLTAFFLFHFVYWIPQCTDLPCFYTRDSTTGTQRASHIQQPLLGQAVVAQTVDGDTLKISICMTFRMTSWFQNFTFFNTNKLGGLVQITGHMTKLHRFSLIRSDFKCYWNV